MIKTRKISKSRFFNDIVNERPDTNTSPFEKYPGNYEVKSFVYEKMKALKAVSDMCCTGQGEITDKELTLCSQLTLLISLPNIHPIRLAAAVSGLDLIFQKWRRTTDLATLSKISDRKDKEVAHWRRLCLNRDNRTCVSCGSKRDIAVHHILSWAEYPESRLDVSNGQTLCGECHHKEHPNMGHSLFVKN